MSGIIGLQLENIKKIKAVRIEPKNNVVEICGRNGQGKSTILDSIWWVLKGKDNIQQMPVRKGEEKGLIRLELDKFIIERKFKVDKDGKDYSTTITVSNKDGAKFSSPQAVLDSFTGLLGFDPLAFSRMDSKAQYNTIRKNAKFDTDIDAIDAQYKSLFEKRTDINRDAKRLAAQAEGIVVENAPEKRVEISALMADLSNAQETNSKVERAKVALDNFTSKKTALQNKIKELEAQILSAKSDIENVDVDIRRGLEFIRVNKPVDTTAIEAQINQADTLNKAFDLKQQKAALIEQQKQSEEESEQLTVRMDALQEQKQRAIEAANLPVKGLGFGDGELLFNGIPLAQLSAAEQLKLSMDIACAENPDLKVILLKDASLLDSESLEYIRKRADETGYQIWMERVDTTGATGFVIEDGELQAQEE